MTDVRLSRPLGIVLMIVLAASGRALGQNVLPAPTAPPSIPQAINVRVDSVLAANTNEGCDVRLQTMSNRLKRMFNYTTYRLISHEDRQADLGELVDFNLPGGRILHLEPRNVEGHMVGMQVVLFSGERPIMSTDVRMRNGAVLLLAGPHYEQGTLIVSIFVRTNAEAGRPLITVTPLP